MHQRHPLILASTSRWRRELLQRLEVPFAAVAPEVDESLRVAEAPAQRAIRLALEKARAVASGQAAGGWVIGSDQVADLHGVVLRKPGAHALAVAQLRQSSGQVVRFHTAVAVVRAGPEEAVQQHLDLTRAQFRVLDDATIERYLQREQPYDCAGAFRCEGLGITLFEAIECSDPSALIGLPLIALARMLRTAGLVLP